MTARADTPAAGLSRRPHPFAPQTRVFRWQFDSSAERIWTILADTEKFNEAAKLPKYDVSEQLNADDTVDFNAVAKIGLAKICWQELPTNWIKNAWFDHERRFTNGPLEFLRANLKLIPDGETCRGEYTLTAQPRNFLGWLMLATTFFSSTKRNFDKLAEQANRFASGNSTFEFDFSTPQLQPGALELLKDAAAQVAMRSFDPALVARLVDFLTTAPEVDVRRIRPLAVARRWGVPEFEVLELFIAAASSSLLAMSWDLLCPRCQGAKARSASLDRLPVTAHCSSCNIDYGRDYAKNVELTFASSRALRTFAHGEFCLFSPMTTPHVWAQITVPPHQSLSIDRPPLPKKPIRLRTLEAGAEVYIDQQSQHLFDAIADAEGVRTVLAETAHKIQLSNQSNRSITFILDEATWSQDALTADRVFSMQIYRDLLDDSTLRPGDQIQIDHASIMFIDFKGSTALYNTKGDIKAYHLVREFFAICGAAVRHNQGAVVKTVGDAVNAAFSQPEQALAAAIDIRKEIDAYNAGRADEPIVCKIGLHAGPTIAVTLNNRLDYYGTVVNQAARLSDWSDGQDIVMSAAMISDRRIAHSIRNATAKREYVPAKGFSDDLEIYRLHFDTCRQSADVSPALMLKG